MPIRDLQQRHAEHGRIRIGRKVATSSGKTRPDKLDRFRFTSGDRGHIEALAQVYGGTAAEWKNGTKAEWEVITDAKSIPVIAYRNSVTQWMETWSGGGCVHRCDGYHNVLTDTPCNPEDRAHRDAKPTTRLSVMLSDLESLGTWRLETHGWNAACELPAMAELAAFVSDYVPARLVLQQRTAIKDGKTSQFVVPVLDLAITKQRLNQVLTGATAPQLEGGSTDSLQIEAGGPSYLDLLEGATTAEECKDIWRQAGEAGELTEDLKAAITERGKALTPAPPAPQEEPAPQAQPDEHGIVDAEVVDDDPAAADAAWMQCVQIAGSKYGWTSTQLRAAFQQQTGKSTDQGSAADFDAFAADLKNGQVAA